MKEQLIGIRRMLGFVIAGAVVAVALNAGAALQPAPGEPTPHVATIERGQG